MISFIIPVFNEEECIDPLFDRISKAMEGMNEPFEVLFIDDGSTDHSMEHLLDLRKQHQQVKILEFSRNFGQGPATFAGLDYAQGDAVIMMDGDLQHPPELIPELIKKWREGYDIVYTIRKKNLESSAFKRFTSSLFPRFISFISAVQIPEGAADFRIIDKNVIEAFRSFHENKIYMRGLIFWMGFRTCEIPYEAPERYGGVTKYRFVNLIRLAESVITSFSSMPLYLSAIAGMIISVAGFLYGIYSIWDWFVHGQVPTGFTTLIVAVLFFGGIQLIAMGILGIYIGKIYDETKQRPRYIIRKKYF